MIPARHRVPGAAVFWGNKAADIHHVAYLYKPVTAGKPDGDWYIIEARGVMYGVVMTKLLSRKPNFWGIMDKYFDYGTTTAINTSTMKILRNGSEGEAVKQLQTNLIRLGYNCGKWGADGDFGDSTEMAVRTFQKDQHLTVDGEYGPKSADAMDRAIAKMESSGNEKECGKSMVKIVGGNCYVRSAPNTTGRKLGVVRDGEIFSYAEETSDDGWLLVEYENQNGWVSGKYGKLMEG